MTSSCRLISNLLAFTATAFGLTACVSSSTGNDATDPTTALIDGTISYPFIDQNQQRPLGRDSDKDKFIIRSAVGGSEYTVEIPGAARDYDVQVPLAELGVPSGDPTLDSQTGKPAANPVTTDQEMVASLPQLDKERPTDTTIMDGAFGVANKDGPTQAPSYTLGLAKINELYKRHEHELALIEINNLLAFYPNSPKLNKMKGTVLLKMRNYSLAELAWIKALELQPHDKALRHALARLQKRILASRGDSAPSAGEIATPAAATATIPKPVGGPPGSLEHALGH